MAYKKEKEITFTFMVDENLGGHIGEACGLSKEEGAALMAHLKKAYESSDTYTETMGIAIDGMNGKELSYLLIVSLQTFVKQSNPIEEMLKEMGVEPVQ